MKAARLALRVLALASAIAATAPAAAARCEVDAKERDAASRLAWEQFDQTGGQWGSFRDLAKEDCYREAVEAYREWLRVNRGFPDDRAKGIGMFHIGQSLALTGNLEGAVSMIRQSFRDVDVEGRSAADWNTYVEGVLAFFAGDRSAIAAARARLSESKREFAERQTAVLQGLEQCVGRLYAEAMSDRCGN